MEWTFKFVPSWAKNPRPSSVRISHWIQVAVGTGCDLGEGQLGVVHKGRGQLKPSAGGRSPSFLDVDLSREPCVIASTISLSSFLSFFFFFPKNDLWELPTLVQIALQVVSIFLPLWTTLIKILALRPGANISIEKRSKSGVVRLKDMNN